MRRNSRILYLRGFRSINFWKEGLELSLRDIYPISILSYSKLFSCITGIVLNEVNFLLLGGALRISYKAIKRATFPPCSCEL